MNQEYPRGQSLLQQVMWGKARGGFRSPVGIAVARNVFLGLDDPLTRSLVEGELRQLRKLADTGQLPPFPSSQLSRGELLLGKDCYGQPVRLPLRALAAGTLLLGNTGAGKTNFLKWILPQIAGAHVPIWVTESYKTELRRLRHLI
jgi:hypothetical protein